MWGSTPSAPAPTRARTVPAITFEPTLQGAVGAGGGAVDASVASASAAPSPRPGPAARAGAAAGSGFRPGPAAPCRSASRPCGGRGRSRRARRRCSGCRRRLRGRRSCRAAASCRSCSITPSLTATTGAPSRGEDVDPAPGRRGGDDFGGVAVGLARLRRRALQRRAGRDVVGVAGVGGDREVGALGQAGQRADQVGRQLAVGAGVEQHLLHVPVGVVVGEDRVVEVAGCRRRP